MSMRFLQAMQATNRMLISIWEPCPALLVAFVACNAFLLPFPFCVCPVLPFSLPLAQLSHTTSLAPSYFHLCCLLNDLDRQAHAMWYCCPDVLRSTEHGSVQARPLEATAVNCLWPFSAFATIELTFDRLGHLATALPPRPVTLIRFSVPGCSPRVSRTTWWV